MADPHRQTTADLKHALVREGHTFSFFQAMRLLRLLAGPQAPIRVRPALSLAFPAADIEKITAGDDFEITATFFGLYGNASPLPTYYTEQLLSDAADDEHAPRDLIDIVNQRLYELLFDCLNRYRPSLGEGDAGQYLERLFCLVGLGEKELRQDLDDPQHLLRYAGLLTQFPRSALGLETMLADALDGIPVSVVACTPRQAPIPDDQRLRLGRSGAALGQQCVLGQQVTDRSGSFRIRIGPIGTDRFQDLMPNGRLHRELGTLTRLYLSDPLSFDFEIILPRDQLQTTTLGQPAWSRLGLDTWIMSQQLPGELSVVFEPAE